MHEVESIRGSVVDASSLNSSLVTSRQKKLKVNETRLVEQVMLKPP